MMKKNRTFHILFLLISALVCVADQAVKTIIRQNISYGESVTVIKDFFYLTYHENTGAAWGIMQGGRMVFIPLTIILIAAMVFLLFRSSNRLFGVSLSFIIGGAAGNLIDRIRVGKVGDFLDFHFGSYIYPSFNVGDMFIVMGTILLSVYLLFIFKGASIRELGR